MLLKVGTLTCSISSCVSSAERVGGCFCLNKHKSRTVAIDPISIIPQLFFYVCNWQRVASS